MPPLPSSTETTGHSHGDDGHTHGMVEVPEEMAVPTVEIEISQDPSSGWNLHIITENFLFAPERSGLAHSPGEGHAHLYIDGIKIARIYAPWYHIGEKLSPGNHEVEVTLYSNDHQEYTLKGETISAKMTLWVEP